MVERVLGARAGGTDVAAGVPGSLLEKTGSGLRLVDRAALEAI